MKRAKAIKKRMTTQLGHATKSKQAELRGYFDGSMLARHDEDKGTIKLGYAVTTLAKDQAKLLFPNNSDRALGYGTAFVYGYLAQTRTFLEMPQATPLATP